MQFTLIDHIRFVQWSQYQRVDLLFNLTMSIIAEHYTYVKIGNPLPRLTVQNYDGSLDLWVNTSPNSELVKHKRTKPAWTGFSTNLKTKCKEILGALV